MELTAQQLAMTTAEVARRNYDKDGHLVPVVHLLHGDGSGAIIIPNSDKLGNHPTDAQPAIVVVASAIFRPRFIVSVTEAWGKTAPPDTDIDTFDMPRGTLAREAETNPDVHTVAMVVVIDCKDYSLSHNVHSTVIGDPRRHEWDVFDVEGLMPGALSERLVAPTRCRWRRRCRPSWRSPSRSSWSRWSITASPLRRC